MRDIVPGHIQEDIQAGNIQNTVWQVNWDSEKASTTLSFLKVCLTLVGIRRAPKYREECS
jgi:hypothetical protein